MIALKRCPHCNGSASLMSRFSYKKGYFVFVQCDICNAQGKVFNCDTNPADDEDYTQNRAVIGAVESWNMRYKEGATSEQ